MRNMELKEGERVEVYRADGGLLRSWFRARIISGNGHTYTVRYDYISDAHGNPVVEEVDAEVVLPQPRVMTKTRKLKVGERVEAYDNHAWRSGRVVKALDQRFFVVKVLEPIREKKFHLLLLRPPRGWDDYSDDSEDDVDLSQESGFQSPNESHITFQYQDIGVEMNLINEDHGQVEANLYPHKCLANNTKTKPVSQMTSSYEEDFLKNESTSRKRRAIQSSSYEGILAVSSLPWLEKVDRFPFPKMHAGEERECLFSFEDGMNQPVEEDESSQSSVPSKSHSYMSSYKSLSLRKHSNQHVVKSPFDNAQSSHEFPNGTKTESLTEKDVAAKVHKLELRAYHKTMRAFYAFGCLTWKQEVLLTNLRLSLHISEDEHMSELKHLCSAQPF